MSFLAYIKKSIARIAREFGAGLEGNAIQHFPKLKVFEKQILNKMAVSEASVE